MEGGGEEITIATSRHLGIFAEFAHQSEEKKRTKGRRKP